MLNKAYINLNTLKENALKVKKRLNGALFCAVVKADAYGHGAVECATALYSLVDCYAVALIEEGIKLRQGGIDKDILVLIPPQIEDLPRAVYYGLTLTVFTIEQAKYIAKECKKTNKKIKIHIKVNTGMNRLGLDSTIELKTLLDYICGQKELIFEGIYSHFACPENKNARENAIDKFLLAIKVAKGYNNNVVRHISASGGLSCNITFDMVRVGILLYGYKPFFNCDIDVLPIMKITSPVIMDRAVQKGERILYGDCRVKKSGNVAIVRFGYADGLGRKEVFGQYNNRCMDLTAVIAEKGKKQITVLENADKTANKYGTISYEVLCKATLRAEKIYIR